MARVSREGRGFPRKDRQPEHTTPQPEAIGIADPEVAVLAGMLRSGDLAKELADRLVPMNFVTRDAQQTFKAACDVLARGQEINRTALAARLQVTSPGSLEYLMGRVIPRTEDTETFRGADSGILAGALAWWGHDWRLRDSFVQATREIEEGVPAQDVTRHFLRRLEAIEDLADPETAYDDLNAHAREMMNFLADRENRGVMWGFRGLDRVVMPALAGDLVEIGGASGSGKSTVARNLVSNWIDMGHKVAWNSCEMSGPTQLMLLSALRTRTSIERLLKKEASYEELDRLDREAGRIIATGKLVLNERSRLTPGRLLSTWERYRSAGAQVFVLDHINRLDYGIEQVAELRLAMGSFARELKSFAQTNGVVVVALVQLVKMSPHEEPDDSNIRESGQIIEEADKILFVWKPLVQHRELLTGELSVITPRVFSSPPQGRGGEGIRMATDHSRVYITPGKQRILPPQALIAVGYDYPSGAMFSEGQ